MKALAQNMASTSRTTRWQRVAAVVAAAFWGLFFYGLIDLLAFLQGEEFHASLLLSTGWGLLYVFLVAAPLCALAFGRGDGGSSVAAELAAVAVGSAVEILVRMPQEITGKPATEWRCTGHVVRLEPVETPRGNVGVGVEFDCYEILRSKTASSI